jgi:2Fe-2S iron-sulfur cluster binding domain
MDRNRKASRIQEGIVRGDPVGLFVDGQPVKAYKGETIAAALMNAGYFVSRTIDGQSMGVYCNIGVCHSCVMTVNGISSVRICKTLVSEGCRVESQHFQKGSQGE